MFQQGGLVEGASFVPITVSLSSAEAEYNVVAFAMPSVANQRPKLQELYGNHPDEPLTIPSIVIHRAP